MTRISRFAAWFGFTGVFLLAGLTGHDPWKQDETYSFGIIYHFYVTHSWLVPVNAGMPFMEKPPLYYWTAALCCRLFGGLLPLHDAARLADFFYMAVATVFMGMSAGVLFRNSPRQKEMIWAVPALFLGTLGVVRHAHDLFTDVALLAGSSVALYGMALLVLNDNRVKAGMWLGVGMGMAFLSKGLLTPAIFGLALFFLLLVRKEMRGGGTAQALILAALAASPFLLVWPICLYRRFPVLFVEWFWDNNVGRFLGFSVARLGADNQPGYILYSALWFAFPVFPLAILAAVRKYPLWRQPEYALPAAVSVAGMALLLLSASARALYLLPLIPAFTLFAAQGLADVPGAFTRRWNMAVRFCSAAAIAAVWIIRLALQPSHPLPQILPFIAPFLPVSFAPGYNRTAGVWVAFAALLFFIFSFRPDGRSKPDAAGIWFAGIGTVWITANALLLPWLDETRSYRPVLAQMDEYVAHSSYKGECMNVFHLGESIAPMYEYFGRSHALDTVQDFAHAACPLVLAVTYKSAPGEPGWNIIWRGSRTLDAKDEELRVYARK